MKNSSNLMYEDTKLIKNQKANLNITYIPQKTKQ